MEIPMMVFCSVLAIGVLAIAALKSGHADELMRLSKQKRRLAERDKETGEDDIFTKQRDDYQYEKMKTNWIITTVASGVVFAIIMMFGVPELMVVGFIMGLPIGAAGFIFYLNWIAKKRQARMTEQLPQVLETMVSSLRAGSPILECFKVIAETSPDPIRGEFKRGLISLQLGKPFKDTLKEMCVRIKAPDFALLCQAIFISQDVGGNLAEVVSVIADAIRERFKLRDFLAALTSQGKATALFIGCLPYGITMITYLATPGYIIPFLNHPVARIVLLLLIIWEGIGFYILMKMTTFEV